MCILFCLTLCVVLEATTHDVSKEEARVLVISALKANTRYTQAPGFDLDSFDDPYFPGFYAFEALWDNPSGSVHLGAYNVNRRTADVWDVSDIDNCKRLTSRTIETFQRKLQKRSGLNEKQFRKLQQEAPCHPATSESLPPNKSLQRTTPAPLLAHAACIQ
jgi:hypothetical protein